MGCSEISFDTEWHSSSQRLILVSISVRRTHLKLQRAFLRLPVSPDPCQAPSLHQIIYSSCVVAPNYLCTVTASSKIAWYLLLVTCYSYVSYSENSKGRGPNWGVNFEGHVPQLGSKQIVGFQSTLLKIIYTINSRNFIFLWTSASLSTKLG